MSDTPKANSVLLIDDNEVDNMINLRLIEKTKFAENIYTFTSGKGALEFFKNVDRLKNFPQELIPNVVFLDINMPIMSGFSFIKSLDKLSDTITKNIKIVLLSQSDNPNDVKQAKEFKTVIDYIVKPLSEEKLKQLKLSKS